MIDWEPVQVSLRTALTATALTLALGLLAARWRVGRRGWFVEFLDGVLLFPLALPPTVVGLVLLMVFGRQSPIGAALAGMGWTIVFSWPATVIAATAVAFPIMYQTAKGAFQQVDAELLDAGRVFGYSETRLLCEVMLPLAWPGILAGIILSFVRALGEFGATLMLAGNIPGQTQTIPIAIFFHVEGGDMAGAAWLSAVIVGISITALVILGRLGPDGTVPARTLRP